jgi:hypothetical protein
MVIDNKMVTSRKEVIFILLTNKTDCHDIIEILLKVALNTITLTPNQ